MRWAEKEWGAQRHICDALPLMVHEGDPRLLRDS